MSTILELLGNNKSLILLVGRTYEFNNGMKVPCLMYWTYAQTDVWLF